MKFHGAFYECIRLTVPGCDTDLDTPYSYYLARKPNDYSQTTTNSQRARSPRDEEQLLITNTS